MKEKNIHMKNLKVILKDGNIYMQCGQKSKSRQR